MRLIQGAIAVALVVCTASLSVASPATADDNCNFSGWQGSCDVVNGGDHVDIGAEVNRPAPPGGSGGNGPDAAAPVDPPTTPCTRQSCPLTVATPPDLTAADLASFRPAAPTLTGEPTGFGILAAPTNIVAGASEQYLTGTVLGWDVTVRFVPAGYVFDYGDGTTARTATGGAMWDRLGQAQFTPTATSHVYRDRGTFSVNVTVQYAASVDFGSGVWRPVTGYVTAAAGGYDVEVVEARTALVDLTCLEDPTGPGC